MPLLPSGVAELIQRTRRRRLEVPEASPNALIEIGRGVSRRRGASGDARS
jgi:hypothetical protein